MLPIKYGSLPIKIVSIHSKNTNPRTKQAKRYFINTKSGTKKPLPLHSETRRSGLE
jgi:hypothetical protein